MHSSQRPTRAEACWRFAARNCCNLRSSRRRRIRRRRGPYIFCFHGREPAQKPGTGLAYFLAINLIAGFPCGSLAPRSRKNRYCSARLARPRPGPRDRLYVGRDLPLVTYSAQNGAVFARSRTLLSPRNAPRSPLDESGAGPRRPGGAPGSYASALSEKRKSYRTPTQIFAADRGRVFSRRVSRGRNCTSDEGGGTTRRSGRRPAL